MKKLLVPLSMMLASVTWAQAPTQCEKVVNVASWNIQWLGNVKAGKRAPQSPDDMAAYIRVSKADVIALSEISVTSRTPSGQALSSPLDETFNILNKDGGKWRYAIFEKRPGGSMDGCGMERSCRLASWRPVAT